MALVDRQDLIFFIKDMMGASFDKVSDDGFDKAITQAEKELNWVLPLDNSFQEFWLVERTKRYVTAILLFESAHKFQYKKLYLQHRFDHYIQMLKMMDEEFKEAIESNPDKFDTSSGTVLCFYLTNGFQYNSDGSTPYYWGD